MYTFIYLVTKAIPIDNLDYELFWSNLILVHCRISWSGKRMKMNICGRIYLQIW